MDKNLFNKNMQAMAKYNISLYQKLCNFNPDSDKFLLDKARNGSPTLKIKEGKTTRLVHSRYNPEREADKWVKKINLKGEKKIFFLGLGLGYHLRFLLERKKGIDYIIVIEPELSTLYWSFHIYDYSNYIRENKLIFVYSKGENENYIRQVLASIDMLNMKTFFSVTTPLTGIYHKDVFAKLNSFIKDHLISCIINFNTTVTFKYNWLNNFKHNMTYLFQHPGIDVLKNKFVKFPAIIVSAGPSLDKNIHLLKQAKDKAVIIGVGTSLKAIQNTGVRPDIVVSVDPAEANWKHFQSTDYDDVYLVGDILSYYKILDQHNGKKFFFSTSAYNVIQKLLPDEYGLPPLRGGGSVSHSAMELALLMGCEPVIFIGQDLAIKEDGTTHASNTIYSVEKDESGESLMEVEGIDGTNVETPVRFYSFLRWFEKRLAMLPEKKLIIDATEGGAKIKGTKVMDFKDALDKYCNTRADIYSKLDELHRQFCSRKKEVLIKHFKENISNLNCLKKACRRRFGDDS